MKKKIEKLILKIYQLLPTGLQEKQCIMNLVMPIAEKQLQIVKQDVLRKNWEKIQLEEKLKTLKK
ncbi:MAG: hypothetical protein Q4E53_06190 [Eubacteriales bacterium]|nr:hypothetical protein [Eubacteriales bacterium]